MLPPSKALSLRIENTVSELARPGSEYAALTGHEVDLIAQGRQDPMRIMDGQLLAGGIASVVKFVAPRYGARQEVDGALVAECVAIARDQFGHLGLREIRQAYRLWAGGRFKALEMYGGQFNVTQFGRVLSAYDRYRRSITMELARQQYLERREAEQQRISEEFRKEYDRILANFPADVRAAKEEGRYDHPSDIPLLWFSLAEDADLIHYTRDTQKAEIWAAAQEQVRREQASARTDAGYKTLSSLRRHQDTVGRAPAEIRGRKLVVWVVVLGRELPTDE
jgi:hypothetical protein